MSIGRPIQPEINKAEEPKDDNGDLALKVARGEVKMTFEDIERMKQNSKYEALKKILEE